MLRLTKSSRTPSKVGNGSADIEGRSAMCHVDSRRQNSNQRLRFALTNRRHTIRRRSPDHIRKDAAMDRCSRDAVVRRSWMIGMLLVVIGAREADAQYISNVVDPKTYRAPSGRFEL